MSDGPNGMEHPGCSILNIKQDNTIDEIQSKIKDLTIKLNFAYSMQNQALIYQLQMVLETYNRAQLEVLDEMFGNSANNEENEAKIDIS